MLRVQVIRALADGRFKVEYDGSPSENRVALRITIERMQDEFDEGCEPRRAYIAKDGVPIEAAYCLRKARD